MWKLNTDERMIAWLSFRKMLDSLPLDKAAQAVIEFWQPCPFSPYYLDPEHPEAWPSPWQLIADNYYCDLGKALGMLYTIYFTKHGANLEAELEVYKDPETGYIYNLVVLNDIHVLNLKDNLVVNTTLIPENFSLIHCFDSVHLKLSNY